MQNLWLHLDMFRLGSGNFVNRTQTESESEIPRNKKVKKMHFYACILDSIMLQAAYVIMGRGDSVHSEEYKKYRNTYV